MNAESIALIWIAALAFLPVVIRLRRSLGPRAGIAVMAVWIAGSTALGYLASQRRPDVVAEADVVDRPIEVDSAGYVSSKTCQSCHPGEYHSWHGSFHRGMTQLPSPDTVIGDFDNAEVSFVGHKYKLERVDDEFWVELDDLRPAAPGVNRPRIRRRIELLTGSHHMQVYWFSAGQGRKLSLLPIVWLKEAERWIPRTASFLQPPSGRTVNEDGRWNFTCVRCHTTHEEPRADDESNVDSRVGEFGISCEACHGPGHEHIRLHSDPRTRYRLRMGDGDDSTIVQPTKLDDTRSSQVCGQCHSIHLESNKVEYNRWFQFGKRYRPGEDLTETITPILETNRTLMSVLFQDDEFEVRGSYWSDGMVRVSGREYNGLLESPCYVDGHGEQKMSCMSCHLMHPETSDREELRTWANDQLKPGMRGNTACLQCHSDYEARLEEHTHHGADSAGSLCYNCHMSHTTYGLLTAIRSHKIDSPSVETSLETGRPNACNQCHLDQTLAWSAKHLKDWYGQESPALAEDERTVAASLLWTLKGDAGQRALMAWSFGWDQARKVSGSEWMAPYVAGLLNDDYEALRYVAGRSLRRLPGYESFEYDFTERSEALDEAVERAMEVWRNRRGESGLSGYEAALINPDGTLRQSEIDRLLLQRNHSPVVLNE